MQPRYECDMCICLRWRESPIWRSRWSFNSTKVTLDKVIHESAKVFKKLEYFFNMRFSFTWLAESQSAMQSGQVQLRLKYWWLGNEEKVKFRIFFAQRYCFLSLQKFLSLKRKTETKWKTLFKLFLWWMFVCIPYLKKFIFMLVCWVGFVSDLHQPWRRSLRLKLVTNENWVFEFVFGWWRIVDCRAEDCLRFWQLKSPLLLLISLNWGASCFLQLCSRRSRR